ncbi:MAG: hypothetical protein LUE92_13815 [Clostridiales bacterium]|nr:hypothetical protein [Clostridiales bacterium]
MAIQFIIIRGTTGYDVSNMFEEITWSGRKGAAPRSVKITLIDDDGHNHSRVSVDCAEGDTCVFYENGSELFRGIIVSHQQSASKKMTITAYDNAFYLANNKDSFCYSNKTATQIFNDCMTRIGMTGGDTVDTVYVIPELPKAKTTYYDVLLDALSTTYKATGIRYYISSEEGNIHLRQRSENALQWVLEAGSDQANLTDYTYTKSIENIKTRVRLLSKEDAVVYEQTNSELEEKIGTFMEVKSVDDSYTQAQMQELVESVFEEKGTPTQSLKVSGAGISEAISGRAVYVIIPHLGLKRTFYVDEDTHKYTRESHTMTLKLNFASDIDAAG